MSNGLVSIYRHKGALLQQVLHGATTYISDIAYNEKGQREHIYYGNNTKTRYYYNPLNFRLTRILTTRNSGIDILQDLNYTYDTVGNIIGQTDNAQQTFYFNNTVVSPTGTYTYDALYRLLTATGREQTALAMPTDADFVNNIPCPDTATTAMQNYIHNYQYDALGNMLQMQSVGNWTRNYVYNNPMTNNYLLGHGSGTVYTYDAHGNMLTMPHLTAMAWDYLDQLHSAGNGTFTSYYNYDAEGKRTRKVVVKNNIREERYYMGDYEVYRKYINNTLDTERNTLHISDDEKRFAIIDTLTVENGEELDPYQVTIRYQYDNHLGSACLELDGSASIISYEEYHPFGTTSYRSGRTETEVSLKRYKYCGKERDEETGLYYYGMRYYAAWICRFVSVDPLQFKYPELTPFQYASNNPVSMIDLDGKEGIRTIQNYGLTKEDFENPMVQQQVKEAQAIYNLNMIANSPNFQNKMKESYELSFNNTTGEIREVSSTIIIKKNQVDLINIEVGGASGANLNLTTGANEQLIGSLHNHPYIREELENMAKKFNLVSKSTGTPPSVTDVKTAAYNFQTSQTIIVDEGSKLYAIYIINHEKALDLALTLGEIEAQILDDIETGKIKSDSIQDALMQGILNYFDSPDSGMLFLESKDRENPNFEIIKNKNYE